MTTSTGFHDAFDAHACFMRLKEAGMPEKQAHVLADGLRKSLELQKTTLEKERRERAEHKARRQKLATKQDLAREIEKVRLDIEALRNETTTRISEITGKLSETASNIEQAKSGLIKWQIGFAITVLSLMAGGLGGLLYIMARALKWTGF